MARKEQKIILARRLAGLIRKADKTEQDRFEIQRLRQELALIDLTANNKKEVAYATKTNQWHRAESFCVLHKKIESGPHPSVYMSGVL
jgi:hypothetical protein